jgi:hypothetical protein
MAYFFICLSEQKNLLSFLSGIASGFSILSFHPKEKTARPALISLFDRISLFFGFFLWKDS